MDEDVVCKGAWLLGTACGKCSRCVEEARRLIPELDRKSRDAAIENAKLSAALNTAPRPTTKASAEWMVLYMDWFFQQRIAAIEGR